MRISLDTQRELYRQHAAEAGDRLKVMLDARVDELVQLGFERAFDTVGVHEYGDSTYWKPTEQLSEEAAAELGIRENAASAALFRLRRALRTFLEQEGVAI